jgi:hypothetical protein
MTRLAVFGIVLSAAAIAADHDSAPYFKLLDRSGDGVIRADEVAQSPWAKRLDTNSDGGVTPEELAAGWDKFPALRAGLAGRFPEAAGYPRTEPTPAAPIAEASPRQGPKLLPPASGGIGTLIPDLTLNVLGVDERSLSALAAGKPLVIANVSPSCPISKRYLPTLLALQKQFSSAVFVFLATNQTDTDASLRESLPASIIARDSSGTLLQAIGAKSSTDCFVLDAQRTLKYRGAIDDQYGLGYSLDAPRERYLAPALQAVMEGRSPTIAATAAPGCELDLSTSRVNPFSPVTFHNRISRILQQNCQECHHAGGVAPFKLESLEDVEEHAGMIRKMVTERLMPPWFAAPPAAGEHSPWLNDRSLPERDRADLLTWLAAGRVAGDVKDTPLPRVWPTGEWTIGKPDAVFQIPQPFAVKATGTMPYQTARVATSFTETRYVSAVEVLPTARDVVHHVLVFADGGGRPLDRLRRVLERSNGSPRRGEDDEAGGFFGIYVPGNNVLEYPDGFAKELPAGATLRFQIHYTPNGTATEDQVRVGLKFAKEPPRHIVHNAGISNRRFAIPPGADNHSVEAYLPVPREAAILAFLPHMHLRGKAWRYEAITPGTSARVLLDVPRYDFNWQLLYRFAEPVRVPAGSSLKATAWFDNSAANPANPDATKLVRWGPQTFDEMMLGYVEYYLPAEELKSVSIAR